MGADNDAGSAGSGDHGSGGGDSTQAGPQANVASQGSGFIDLTGAGSGHGRGSAGQHYTPPPPPPPQRSGSGQETGCPAQREGRAAPMPVMMWLKPVRAEVRRQAVTMGVEWTGAQLYHEVAARREGEA
ncbi:hypothetical protein PHYPSEUDO_008729 [Phytophthora pseudosyringae]|uniref:Uncharacterized protein n=1 Tax=Phytophthora pseudosyringae TaxID=221518 RepID=A0A8T1VGR1_9STRA|nr:hypothetical protein PHYPSEUDO_008729 [Phytophthora pseudosyringae]